MVTCPVCTEVQLVYVQGPRRTSCYYCGADWIQQGTDQQGAIRPGSLHSAMRPTGTLQPAMGRTR
jgi:hypothetical protein